MDVSSNSCGPLISLHLTQIYAVINRVAWQYFITFSDILSLYLSLSLVLSLVTQREDVPAVIGTAANTGLQSDF